MARKIIDDAEPSSGTSEGAFRTVKAGIGQAVVQGAALATGGHLAVPGAIAAVATLITEHFWLPHLSMRKDAIINEVAAKMKDVDQEVFQSPAFIDALSAGVQAAIKTSSETKREALRNSIVNSVRATAPGLVKQQQFFALTDKYSELHLMLLDLFATAGPSSSRWYQSEHAIPNSPLRQAGTIASAEKMAEKVFHQHEIEFIRHVWGQLIADGLVRAPLDNGGEGDITKLKRTTSLGDEYLKFIRE